MAFRVFAAKAMGKSHIDSGIPCQDAFAFEFIDDVLIAAVCDGAGSAALSHIGSQTAATLVVNYFAALCRSDRAIVQMSAEAFKCEAEKAVIEIRAALQALAITENTALQDYAATLVGVVLTRSGGYFFHIGDGLAIAQTVADQNHHAVISLPENGEYANETYFITGGEWQAHLRITAIPTDVGVLALMSDGAAPFVMNKTSTDFFRPFIEPVRDYLQSVSEQEGSAALAGTLADERTYQITSDDKALLIALWQ
jgi:serine/threonine protein phosphatase PrpC